MIFAIVKAALGPRCFSLTVTKCLTHVRFMFLASTIAPTTEQRYRATLPFFRFIFDNEPVGHRRMRLQTKPPSYSPYNNHGIQGLQLYQLQR